LKTFFEYDCKNDEANSYTTDQAAHEPPQATADLLAKHFAHYVFQSDRVAYIDFHLMDRIVIAVLEHIY